MSGLNDLKVSFLAVGGKGFAAIDDVSDRCRVGHIATYPQHTSAVGIDEFTTLADRLGARLHLGAQPPEEIFEDSDVVFAVGWQYMIPNPPPHLVILHDSLLPAYRGFAPTVSALVQGETEIGVTALLPAEQVDAGDVLAQAPLKVVYPIRIAEAFQRLRPCYTAVIVETLHGFMTADRTLSGRPQRHEQATYGQWRDEQDYFVDLSKSSVDVQRHVHAVGAPYGGARVVTMTGEVLIVGDADVLDDVEIVGRMPGKAWAIRPDGVDIVCGEGLVRLRCVEDAAGDTYRFASLRTRLHSTPASAFLAGTRSA